MDSLPDARMIVESLPMPAFLLDADDVVVAVNAPALSTFAHPDTDPVGKNFKDVLTDAWRAPLLQAVDATRREAHAQHAAVGVAADDGGSVWDVWVERVGVAGNAATLVAAHDARAADRRWGAELQTLNEELRVLNEELNARLVELSSVKQADLERNRFLAMLAHELRNPLAGIASAVHILRKRQTGAGDRVAEQALRIAERQVKSQSRLLDDLLDVSRIVLGKISLRLETVDLAAVTRQALETVSFDARARAQKLRVELPEQPVSVLGDAVRLEQVVANLLGNAVKYTPEGGQIAVVLTATDETASLMVSDTGRGIEGELLERIFDLFVQGDTTRTRTTGGLGIGLTVARHLVELHRGTIRALSAGPDRGSVFEVCLPSTHDAAAPREEPPAPATSARRVLVVDDNRDAREMLRTILELGGHQVRDTPDGAEAVKLAVGWTPDVALVDIGLRGIDGYEVAKRIRRRLGAGVRLIALTGYGDAEARQLSLEAGFDEHLVKPVDPDVLDRMIDRG
ncbi:MAG TPA: ATP-binding protein [Methylomirabilota bacterium]|jgi:signal transduction histidine kinase|nr:ATP-binding protein [Methylomirabilota bacterium]